MPDEVNKRDAGHRTGDSHDNAPGISGPSGDSNSGLDRRNFLKSAMAAAGAATGYLYDQTTKKNEQKAYEKGVKDGQSKPK